MGVWHRNLDVIWQLYDDAWDTYDLRPVTMVEILSQDQQNLLHQAVLTANLFGLTIPSKLAVGSSFKKLQGFS